MKLLVILLLVLFLTAWLGVRPGAGGETLHHQPMRRISHWRLSLTILVLRITRGGLALLTLLTVFMAFRLLLVSGVSANTQHSAEAWWVFAGMAAGSAVLFYFLFWTLRRIRQRVNQMHAERSQSSRPLLAGHWSF